MRAAFLIARFLRRFFRASALRRSLSSMILPRFPPWFFRRVGCSTPTTPRLLHSRFFCLLTCDVFTLLAAGPTLSAAVSQRSSAGTVAAGNNFALLGCITTSRCCWHACTVSIGKFSHQSMSSCETSIDARTPQTAVIASRTTKPDTCIIGRRKILCIYAVVHTKCLPAYCAFSSCLSYRLAANRGFATYLSYSCVLYVSAL